MICVKNFETNMVSRIMIDDIGTKIVPFFGMRRSWYRTCFKSLKKYVSPELLILCPIYTSEEGKDFQVGITGGKNKEDRTLMATLVRECSEEIGLVFNEDSRNSNVTYFNDGKYRYLFCIAELDAFEPYTKIQKDFDPVERPDSQKIICFPVDNQENIERYFARKIIRAPNLHEHIHLKEVAAVPIWYLIERGII